MRTIIFAKRNFKEIVRDPVSIIFAVILPLFYTFFSSLKYLTKYII